VIECAPTAKLEVAKVAIADPFSVLEPSAVEPSLKVTAPVGVVEPVVDILAVKVTVDGATDGFGFEASMVAVAC
jgi:hypothetical protein